MTAAPAQKLSTPISYKYGLRRRRKRRSRPWRDRRRAAPRAATVMRHFLRALLLAISVGLLTAGMKAPPSRRLLVATSSRPKAVTPSLIPALPRAITMPPITPRAEVDSFPATIANEATAIGTAAHGTGLLRPGLRHPQAEYSSSGASHPRPSGGGRSPCVESPPPVSPSSHPGPLIARSRATMMLKRLSAGNAVRKPGSRVSQAPLTGPRGQTSWRRYPARQAR